MPSATTCLSTSVSCGWRTWRGPFGPLMRLSTIEGGRKEGHRGKILKEYTSLYLPNNGLPLTKLSILRSINSLFSCINHSLNDHYMITVNAFMGDAYSFPNLRKLLTFLVCKDILSHFSQTKNNSNSSFSLLPPNLPNSTYLINLLQKSLYPSNNAPNQKICIFLLCLSLFLSFLLLTLSRTLSHFQFHTFHSFLKTALPFHTFISFFFFYYTYHLPPSKTHCRTRFAPTCRCTSASWGMRTISDHFGW